MEARAANAAAKVSDAEAEIVFLKLTVEKLRRELHGWRSERKQRLLDQLELQLDELETSATEDELAAEQAAAGTIKVQVLTRRRPARKPFPAHLAREWVSTPDRTDSSHRTKTGRRPTLEAYGFLGTASTLAADEGGTFSVLRSYERDHATLEHAAGTITEVLQCRRLDPATAASLLPSSSTATTPTSRMGERR